VARDGACARALRPGAWAPSRSRGGAPPGYREHCVGAGGNLADAVHHRAHAPRRGSNRAAGPSHRAAGGSRTGLVVAPSISPIVKSGVCATRRRCELVGRAARPATSNSSTASQPTWSRSASRPRCRSDGTPRAWTCVVEPGARGARLTARRIPPSWMFSTSGASTRTSRVGRRRTAEHREFTIERHELLHRMRGTRADLRCPTPPATDRPRPRNTTLALCPSVSRQRRVLSNRRVTRPTAVRRPHSIAALRVHCGRTTRGDCRAPRTACFLGVSRSCETFQREHAGTHGHSPLSTRKHGLRRAGTPSHS
jgi:hypothetical protein